MIRSFKDLFVWQSAIELSKEIYLISAGFPRTELYGLVSQMRRAAVSISANIAEGHGRGTRRDYTHFVTIALGSAREVESLLHLAIELEFTDQARTKRCHELLDKTSRMLNSLRSSLRKPEQGASRKASRSEN